MSLQITTPITTLEGIVVENAYGRVAVVDQFAGVNLQSQVQLYASEEAFVSGANALHVILKDISIQPYDRNVQGTDILAIGHQDLQLLLASQGIESTINL